MSGLRSRISMSLDGFVAGASAGRNPWLLILAHGMADTIAVIRIDRGLARGREA